MKSFDVIAVDTETKKVRVVSDNRTSENAEAIRDIWEFNQRDEEEIYKVVAHGSVSEGEEWNLG